MEDDGPLIATRCLEPGRDSEGLAPPEVAHRRLHRMVAREVHGLAGVPLDERILRRRTRGLVCGKQAGELAIGAAFVKGIANDLSRNRAGLGGRQCRWHLRLVHDPVGDFCMSHRLALLQIRL